MPDSVGEAAGSYLTSLRHPAWPVVQTYRLTDLQTHEVRDERIWRWVRSNPVLASEVGCRWLRGVGAAVPGAQTVSRGRGVSRSVAGHPAADALMKLPDSVGQGQPWSGAPERRRYCRVSGPQRPRLTANRTRNPRVTDSVYSLVCISGERVPGLGYAQTESVSPGVDRPFSWAIKGGSRRFGNTVSPVAPGGLGGVHQEKAAWLNARYIQFHPAGPGSVSL